MKNDYRKTSQTFFRRCSILSYFSSLNCYNFLIALTKSIKLHFLKIVLEPLKRSQNLHSYGNPGRSNSPLKIFENCIFCDVLLEKRKKIKHCVSHCNTAHPRQNYGLSNIPFHFTDSYICHRK